LAQTVDLDHEESASLSSAIGEVDHSTFENLAPMQFLKNHGRLRKMDVPNAKLDVASSQVIDGIRHVVVFSRSF